MNWSVEVEDLGKRFWIGASLERPTLMQDLRHWATGARAKRELWAVRGVGFQLAPGEVLGLIGPNGAGKSTLLLLLAGILQPSEGRASVRGRASCFFQLSAGLQPDLTVRDNFALCAALLGLSGAEFERAWPGILEFSGLENYLEARLTELSTGLAARLPFSTAIHAPVDVLLVDEMLSVGDQAFQARCLGAFRALLAQGRSLILVSHSMPLVRSLCPRTLYINAGRPVFLGETNEAIARYNADVPSNGAVLEEFEERLRASDSLLARLDRGLSSLETRSAALRAAPIAAAPDPAVLKQAATQLGEFESRLSASDKLLARLDRGLSSLEKRGAALRSAPPPPAGPPPPWLNEASAQLGDIDTHLRATEALLDRLNKAIEKRGAIQRGARPDAAAWSNLRVDARSRWKNWLGWNGPIDILDSFTSAAWCALAALCEPTLPGGLRPGDEIITAACNFPRIGTALHSLGLRAVFIDMDPGTLGVSTETVIKALSPQTKALIVPHLAGVCQDISALANLCAERGLLLLELSDCPGAKLGDRAVGTFGDAAAIGLFPETANPWGALLRRKEDSPASPLPFLLNNSTSQPPAFDNPIFQAVGPAPTPDAAGFIKAIAAPAQAWPETMARAAHEEAASFFNSRGRLTGRPQLPPHLQPPSSAHLLLIAGEGRARALAAAARRDALPVFPLLGGACWAPPALRGDCRQVGDLAVARRLCDESLIAKLPADQSQRRDFLARIDALLQELS